MQDGHDPGRTEVPVPLNGHYPIKQGFTTAGSTFRGDAARGVPVRPNVGFGELPPEQQAAVTSWYKGLAPGDEPPYPVNGPDEAIKAMAAILRKAKEEGDVYVYVLVGTDGKVRRVTALGLKDPAARKGLAAVASLVRYKPAVCAGQPCEMIYPYSLDFRFEP